MEYVCEPSDSNSETYLERPSHRSHRHYTQPRPLGSARDRAARHARHGPRPMGRLPQPPIRQPVLRRRIHNGDTSPLFRPRESRLRDLQSPKTGRTHRLP